MPFTLEDNYIIVNYHYVEDPRPEWGGIHPCSVKEFERHISFLSQNFKFVSVPEVFEAAQKSENKKLCAITFDDGMEDQYENALPILRKYGATATFFIITATFFGYIPFANKIHILLSQIPVSEMIDSFNNFAAENGGELGAYHIPKDRRISERRRYDDILTANFKETMSVILYEAREKFLTNVFAQRNIDEKSLSHELFMSEKEVADLAQQGFYVENHTHRHISLENESLDSIKKELETSQDILKELLGYRPRVISYPYGRISQPALAVLGEKGFEYGVTIEPRAVGAGDNPFLIPRYDVNDAKAAE